MKGKNIIWLGVGALIVYLLLKPKKAEKIEQNADEAGQGSGSAGGGIGGNMNNPNTQNNQTVVNNLPDVTKMSIRELKYAIAREQDKLPKGENIKVRPSDYLLALTRELDKRGHLELDLFMKDTVLTNGNPVKYSPTSPVKSIVNSTKNLYI